MSSSRRHELYVSLKLILCIALGIWLGAVAVILTGPLLIKALPAAQTQALAEASARIAPPPPPAAKQPDTMLRKFEQNLRESEARQAQEYEQARQNRQFNRAKCDFWLQQDRTAPSEKSRASVNEFCG
ncbi:hypothetical protein RRX38_22595 [Pseudomonas sp. DTU_2021_1001937_2_SI_NGA_ILE_001]|uniref:hypothetical protein n=1 Tax=Pseudomonas sp. DTU_2021_1001937_2_SI_NGA_ILE_001 TaxID=3077589 RepID=UPI0028FC0BE8|nr:hypothetical protein [Pseudomonas sp. DTU_2021_1001937_2_SI_NGA_ILE_001]WNW13825.1 hypothetical protein RRX38_22595 [Pseudomonas sp. DTU_2021_1001937_2_SI_NGA_ILE_001]